MQDWTFQNVPVCVKLSALTDRPLAAGSTLLSPKALSIVDGKESADTAISEFR